MTMEEVNKVLAPLGLSQYSQALEKSGFDTVPRLLLAEEGDLCEAGMSKGHCRQLLAKIQDMKATAPKRPPPPATDPSSGAQPALGPGTILLVKAGWLGKEGSGAKKARAQGLEPTIKRWWFSLDGHYLSYFKNEVSFRPVKNLRWDLTECQVSVSNAEKCCFSLVTPKKTLILYASTKDEMDLWVFGISYLSLIGQKEKAAALSSGSASSPSPRSHAATSASVSPSAPSATSSSSTAPSSSPRPSSPRAGVPPHIPAMNNNINTTSNVPALPIGRMSTPNQNTGRPASPRSPPPPPPFPSTLPSSSFSSVSSSSSIPTRVSSTCSSTSSMHSNISSPPRVPSGEAGNVALPPPLCALKQQGAMSSGEFPTPPDSERTPRVDSIDLPPPPPPPADQQD